MEKSKVYFSKTITSENVIELLQSLRNEFGQTIIMVTHDINLSKKSDNVIHIEDGKIISK